VNIRRILLVISISMVLCSQFSRAEELFPGTNTPWKTIRLSDADCVKNLEIAKTSFDGQLLAELVNKWEESLKNALVPPPPPPGAVEMATLDFYRNEMGYDSVNRFLRGEGYGQKSPEAIMAIAILMASALNRLPDQTIVSGKKVYRGTPLENEVLAKYIVGEYFISRSFMSTSSVPPAAMKFTQGTHPSQRKQVFFTIISRTGRTIPDFGGYGQEVIFLPETRFKVLTKSEKSEEVFIEMEETP